MCINYYNTKIIKLINITKFIMLKNHKIKKTSKINIAQSVIPENTSNDLSQGDLMVKVNN